MVPELRSVPKTAEEPPYPPDTKVRGWRFQLDHERINQSDTWALATTDMRPWLLMLWHVAWQQVPAGSMPDDDQLISAKIGMELRQFRAHRDILMRGWTRHTDGRLYHGVVVEQVKEYQEHNRRERERMQRWREQKQAQSNASVTCDKRVSTTPEPEPEPKRQLLTNVSNSETQPKNPAEISRADSVPFAEIQKLWAEILPNLPQPVKLTTARKAQIRARWSDELPDLESWRECFEYVAKSKFLTGRSPPTNGHPPFRATLDWVCKLDNLVKIYEGKYHRG